MLVVKIQLYRELFALIGETWLRVLKVFDTGEFDFS